MADTDHKPHKGARNDLTVEYVRSILDYDPETGILRWKRRGNLSNSWNTKYAGKITGCHRADGNVVISINDRLYLAQRLAWLYATGSWPAVEIDHKNRTRSDNRFINLREATSQQNLQNQGKKPNNTSGYKGVSFFKRDGTWRAQIRYKEKQRTIGYYDTPEAAYQAYCEHSRKYHGEFSAIE